MVTRSIPALPGSALARYDKFRHFRHAHATTVSCVLRIACEKISKIDRVDRKINRCRGQTRWLTGSIFPRSLSPWSLNLIWEFYLSRLRNVVMTYNMNVSYLRANNRDSCVCYISVNGIITNSALDERNYAYYILLETLRGSHEMSSSLEYFRDSRSAHSDPI